MYQWRSPTVSYTKTLIWNSRPVIAMALLAQTARENRLFLKSSKVNWSQRPGRLVCRRMSGWAVCVRITLRSTIKRWWTLFCKVGNDFIRWWRKKMLCMLSQTSLKLTGIRQPSWKASLPKWTAGTLKATRLSCCSHWALRKVSTRNSWLICLKGRRSRCCLPKRCLANPTFCCSTNQPTGLIRKRLTGLRTF